MFDNPNAMALRSWVKRYLELLGLQEERPSLDAFRAITRAHLSRVPFENVSSMLRRQTHPVGPVPPLDMTRILDAWEAGQGGAVCFEAAGMLGRLLHALGYDAHLVLADGNTPGSHQAVLVRLDGRRYLTDVGNGAPYFEPIPLTGVHDIHHPAGLSYRFQAGIDDGTWVQHRWIDGQWTPMFTYHLVVPDPRRAEIGYQRHHTPGQSWVVDTLTLVYCSEHEVHRYRGREYTRFKAGGKHAEVVSDINALARLAREVFHLPNLPVERVKFGF